MTGQEYNAAIIEMQELKLKFLQADIQELQARLLMTQAVERDARQDLKRLKQHAEDLKNDAPLAGPVLEK